MRRLKLKRYELPNDIHKFTEQEEVTLFPKPGTKVLAYIDGDLTMLTFDWHYYSFKQWLDRKFARDGNGETCWYSPECTYIISKHSIRPFEEYWAILD